ncbi:MAG: toll/interleukin-1 receptor domain-containing protein [Terriglobia bacterium]
MAFKVFLSHSLDPAEQVLAWRLQTLAAAHEIEMFVPQRSGEHQTAAGLQSIRQAIDGADCVLAIITADASRNVRDELQYALSKSKLVIPIVRSDLSGHPLIVPFGRIFIFSPWDDPGKIESEIVQFLKEQKISKEHQQAIGGLAALGLGLLLLFSLTEK